MKKIIVFILLLYTQLSFGQLINGGFELWDTAYTGPYSPSMTSLFGVPNPQSGTASHWISSNEWATDQTTDSHSGNYALILHNWYNYARGWISYREPISARPKYLQGYFKYITGGVNGVSHGKAHITLTRFNGIANDTIANGVLQFDSMVAYTPFQITLHYVSTLNPDSIKLYIINSDTNVFSDVVCHLLYLDDLALSDTPLNIEQLTIDKDAVSIYPNPALNELNIRNNTNQLLEWSLYNGLGQRLSKQQLTHVINSINLSDYAIGVYFYELRTEKDMIKTGKIVKQ